MTHARSISLRGGIGAPIRPSTQTAAHQKAINKRVSHLVYNRASHSGGTGQAGPDHLNQQVLPCAEDILNLTKKFIPLIDHADLRAAAQSGYWTALSAEAGTIAAIYGVANRFVTARRDLRPVHGHIRRKEGEPVRGAILETRVQAKKCQESPIAAARLKRTTTRK